MADEAKATSPQNPQDLLGQWQLGDVVDPDQLPDPKAAKVLKGFDVAEPGDWIQELDGCRGETFGKKAILEKSCVRYKP